MKVPETTKCRVSNLIETPRCHVWKAFWTRRRNISFSRMVDVVRGGGRKRGGRGRLIVVKGVLLLGIVLR